MSIYPNAPEQDLINLRKLAEQQKSQRAPKIENRILKQTHDIKVAESLSPKTKKLTDFEESAQKLGDVIKDSNSNNENNQEMVPVKVDSIIPEGDNIKPNVRVLPNSSIFSEFLTKT